MTGTGYVPNRSLPSGDASRAQQPWPMPRNAAMGSTNMAPGLYGVTRQENPFGPPFTDKRQWVAPGAGTSQQKYTTTRLPGDV